GGQTGSSRGWDIYEVWIFGQKAFLLSTLRDTVWVLNRAALRSRSHLMSER
ncbi:unnamed protein product, partial [Tetraodon nigroviridis]